MNKISKFILMLLFLVCALYANFYALRKIMRYGTEVYFYDKLSVAYNIGGMKGLRTELREIRVTDKFPRELALENDFEGKLNSLADPSEFLSEKVAQGKSKISFVKSMRLVAIILMFIIFGWRLVVRLLGKP